MGAPASVINTARSSASSITSLAKQLEDKCNELKTSLTTNGNYQYFKLGTDKGTSVDDKLGKTINATIELLVPQINNVSKTIRNFCDVQEQLNRIEAERVIIKPQNESQDSLNQENNNSLSLETGEM